MRGKDLRYFFPGQISGITPACAGKRRSLLGNTPVRWGSPPHVRGKGGHLAGRVSPDRITPACAGKSMTGAGIAHNAWDHPRMCGEKCSLSFLILLFLGSPPHVRGKEHRTRQAVYKDRITPAHAGKRLCRPDCAAPAKDHPRTCGEKASAPGAATPFVGSPPHMRGKVHGVWGVAHHGGITPAHAGKSSEAVHQRGPRQDHPRTCGEKRHGGPLARPVMGSPPHMRGKVSKRFFLGAAYRITPAHAGKRTRRVVWGRDL